MKRRIKIAAVVAIAGAVVASAVFLKTEYVIPVIMYHSIDRNDKITKLSVSPESFERQMAFLRAHRYNVVGLDAIVRYLEKKEPLPPKTIAVTFDDGYYNNYEHAFPVLKKYRIPATIFVIVDKIGQPGYLGWDQIREMAGSGVVTIGSHTNTHPFLTGLSTAALTEELKGSKDALELALGAPVDSVCYPMGACDDRVERLAREAGYRCAVATNPGPRKADDDPYAIKRIKISRTSDNLLVFWLETSGYYTWVKERGR